MSKVVDIGIDVDLSEEERAGLCDLPGQEYYLLYSCIRTNRISQIPGIIMSVIKNRSWEKWKWGGRDYSARSPLEYIEKKPPRGLGITVKLLRGLLVEDMNALSALDEALRRPVGSNQYSFEPLYNVQALAPTGNSIEAALRRLRRDRPDLHARVLAGELSAHHAAIEAGFRHPPDPYKTILRLIPKLTSPLQLEDIIERCMIRQLELNNLEPDGSRKVPAP